MKILTILFVIALSRGEKLDRLYLPPAGAQYAGGGSSNIDVPFETPKDVYSAYNDSINTFIGSKPVGVGGVISTTPNIQSTENYFNGPASASYYSQTNSPIFDDNNQSYGIIDTFSEHKDIFKGDQEPYRHTSSSSDSTYSSPKNYLLENFSETKDDEGFTKYPSLGPNKVVMNSQKFGDSFPISRYQSTNRPDIPNYNLSGLKSISRPQAEADRNAVIVNYENVITPEGFSYSFDTSNGIHADESGTAIDGVKAHGSYSYIGDDGKLYNVTYSADENGFRPHGDHLPTPPPIPDAILKVIEQATKDKINGIFDDGLYDEKKYGHQKYDSKNYNNNPETLPTLQKKYLPNVLPNSNRHNIYSEDINQFGDAKIMTNSPNYGNDDNIKQSTPSPYRKTSTNDLINLEDTYQPNKSNYRLSSNIYENSLETKNDPIKNPYASMVPSISEYKENIIGYEYRSPQNKFELNRNTVPHSISDGGRYNGLLLKQINDYEQSNLNHYPGKGDSTLVNENNDYISEQTIDPFTGKPKSSTTKPIQYPFYSTEVIDPTTGKPRFSTTRPIQYPFQSTKQIIDPVTGKPKFSRARPIQYPFHSTEQAFDLTTGKPKISTTRPIQYPFHSTEQAFDLTTGKPKISTTRPIQYPFHSTEQAFDLTTGKPKISTTRPIQYPFHSTEQAFDLTTGKTQISTSNPPIQYPFQSTEQAIDVTTGKPKLSTTYNSRFSVRPESSSEYPVEAYSTLITNLNPGEAADDVGNYFSKTTNESSSTTLYPFTKETESSTKYSENPNLHASYSKKYSPHPDETYTIRPASFSYGPSTDRIIGENFVGPKQPQRYDPQTGYHY